jgi:DNA polymerase-3 subunit epsilon
MPGPGFAVIDFETTGLFPGGHDRIIEVAVVHVDPDGRITGQWDTLVNPGRDLGPQRIHCIRSSDVLDAPTFAQIAPRLVELLSGRVVVAHNASFDTRFLLAELERAGYAGWFTLEALCTMQLAREFLPGSGRSLEDCCAAFDIELQGAHRASVDALATAHLLDAYILHNPTWAGWNASLRQAAVDWPTMTGIDAPWHPRGTLVADPKSFLERISVKLPESSGPAEHLDYLALLDRCLLDRNLSTHEANTLVALAESLGISRDTCEIMHGEYFADLTAIAWADAVLTTAEIADLVAVAQMLSIPGEMVIAAMQRPTVATSLPKRTGFHLEAGDLVVLTGEMVRSREDWHFELTRRGYVPWSAVTKKVKLLVAADPDSLSGKARKAREYDITVVGEDHLERMLRA